MSLVFLKNDTNQSDFDANQHMKPYDWLNNFDTPLILPPDSQVAYISSTMERDKVVNFEGDDANIWIQIGDPQLSIPMPLQLNTDNTSAGTSTWTDIAAKFGGYNCLGNADFMSDGLTGGMTGSYNISTKKLDATLQQRLQPLLDGVFVNRGNGSLPSTWSGLNQQNMIVENTTQPYVGQPVGEVGSSTTAVGALFDNGWSEYKIVAGGKTLGSPITIQDNSWACCRSKTGIKRTCFNTTWSPTELGGRIQFRGDIRNGAQGQTANSESIPYICGLNSLQAIQSAEDFGTPFIDGNALNGVGFQDSDYHPTVIGVRIADGKIYVEIMETEIDLDETQNLQFGVWGRCEEEPTFPPNAYSPTGMRIVDEIEIDDFLAAAPNNPDYAGAATTQPYFNIAQATPAANEQNKITFTIKWTTPYTFQVWAGTGFDERRGTYSGRAINGGNQYAAGTDYVDTYSILYDSKTGATFTNDTPTPTKSCFFPRIFGDMGAVAFLDRRNTVQMRGNFDTIKCFPDTPPTNYLSYDDTISGLPMGKCMIPTAQLGLNPQDYPNCYRLQPLNSSQLFPAVADAATTAYDFNDGTVIAGNKGMSDEVPTTVVGQLKVLTSIEQFQKWFRKPAILQLADYIWKPINTSPNTLIGVIMGWIKPVDDGMLDFQYLVATDVENFIIGGAEAVGESEIYNSVHIQLTNLPINGRNGMTSTKTSTIAVIHNAVTTSIIQGRDSRLYNHYAYEKNWIDLNNVAEMTLDQLRVYISGDDNAPANWLAPESKSDVLIMFRQKPAADGGISTQPINKFGLLPGTGQTRLN